MPERPRIAVLSQRYSPQHYVALVAAASAMGADVVFAELTPVRETVKALRARSVRAIPAVWRRFARALVLVSTGGRDADVVVVALAPYDWRMIAASRLTRTRTIYFTSWPYWEPSAHRVPAPQLARARVVQAAWDRFMAGVAAVATVTPQAAAALTDRFPGVRRPVVVGHVVADCFFEAGAARRRAEPAGTTRRVLFVGRLEATKGIDRFIAIAARCGGRDVEFAVAGAGRRTPDVELAERAGTLRHLGRLSPDRLATTMATSHLLVAPGRRTSRWEEVFGMAVAEAAVVGLDVVSTDHVGPRWLSQLAPSVTIVEDDGDTAPDDRTVDRIDDRTVDRTVDRIDDRTDDRTVDRIVDLLDDLLDDLVDDRAGPATPPADALDRFRLERVRARWSEVVHQAIEQVPA